MKRYTKNPIAGLIALILFLIVGFYFLIELFKRDNILDSTFILYMIIQLIVYGFLAYFFLRPTKPFEEEVDEICNDFAQHTKEGDFDALLNMAKLNKKLGKRKNE